MSRALICATALALSLGGLAHAQSAGSYASPSAGSASPTSPDASSPPASPDTSATPDASSSSAASPAAAQDFKPGMPVKDSSGKAVGTIKRVGQTASGTPAAEVTVDGKPIVLALADLTLAPTKDQAIINKSKAEIEAQTGGGQAKP
jgi:hypothetical protein